MKKGDLVILDYESGEVILTSVNHNEEPEDVFNEYSKSVGHSSLEWMSAPEIKVRWQFMIEKPPEVAQYGHLYPKGGGEAAPVPNIE